MNHSGSPSAHRKHDVLTGERSREAELIRLLRDVVPERNRWGLGGRQDLGSIDCVYCGIGLTGLKRPSLGLPFSVVEMLALVAALQRLRPSRKAVILLADVHAAEACEERTSSVWKLRDSYIAGIRALIEMCQWDCEVLLGSQLGESSDHARTLDRLGRLESNRYLARQIADGIVMERRFGRCMKIGWCSRDGLLSAAKDEFWFDSQYVSLVGRDDWRFAYTLGRRREHARECTAPYLALERGETLVVPQRGRSTDSVTDIWSRFAAIAAVAGLWGPAGRLEREEFLGQWRRAAQKRQIGSRR